MDSIPHNIFVGGTSKNNLKDALARHDVKTNEYAEMLFEDASFKVSEAVYSARPVQISVANLGFADGATTESIHNAAKNRGLSICPLEVGPYLRLHFLKQAEGPWIVVASKKLHEDDKFPNGFYLQRRKDGLWLRGYRASNSHIWSPEDLFVFLDRE